MESGLNIKKSEARDKRARKNLALKLSLESTFIPELKSYFSRIVKEVTNTLVKDGVLVPGSLFNEPTRRLLAKQYSRTAKAFIGEMRLFLDENKTIFELETKQKEEDSKVADAVAISVAMQISASSIIRSDVIDRTTDDDIKSAFSEASDQVSTSGSLISNVAISSLMADILRMKFAGRINTIATTETQFMAEATKQIESAVVSRGGEVDPILAGGSIIIAASGTKDWSAILDSVTRQSHVIADGQTQPINEPFIVQGELLRYPADSSLGASASNTINCRCSALYSVF